MAWRFKTVEEFLVDEWTKQGDGTLYYPDGAHYQTDVTPDMMKIAPTLTQAQIISIVDAGAKTIGRYTWTVDMFIDSSGVGLNYRCSCRWARHPLYCKCP